MPTFRKRPVEVEMMQWTGDNLDAMTEWLGDDNTPPRPRDFHRISIMDDRHPFWFYCAASHTDVRILPGDWIAKERDGSGFYPIMEREQAETYEPDEEISSAPS